MKCAAISLTLIDWLNWLIDWWLIHACHTLTASHSYCYKAHTWWLCRGTQFSIHTLWWSWFLTHNSPVTIHETYTWVCWFTSISVLLWLPILEVPPLILLKNRDNVAENLQWESALGSDHAELTQLLKSALHMWQTEQIMILRLWFLDQTEFDDISSQRVTLNMLSDPVFHPPRARLPSHSLRPLALHGTVSEISRKNYMP